MNISYRYFFITLFIISIFLFCGSAFSQTKYEITPGIYASETYDDNINLVDTNETSDYITTVTPSIIVDILSEKTSLDFTYAPTFVWYAHEDQYNTTRHLATLDFQQDVLQHFRFDLNDSYLNSEDPIADVEDLSRVRTTRNKYWRNNFITSFNYLFGPENLLNVGYQNNYVQNNDPTLNDSTIQTPFLTFNYWFNVKNGLEFTYAYTKADFSLEGAGVPQDDFEGQVPGIRYIYRFSPHTSGFIGYTFTVRNFEGPTEDYRVNNFSLGFEHAFSQEVSLSLGGGYYMQNNENSPNVDGYLYNASLVKNIERGNFFIGGNGGWDEDFLQANVRSFLKYYGANGGFQYQLLSNLNSYANGSYRRERDQADQTREIWSANLGLGWSFLQWLTLSLDYVYADRNDENPSLSYKDNRVTLKLAASKLYRY